MMSWFCPGLEQCTCTSIVPRRQVEREWWFWIPPAGRQEAQGFYFGLINSWALKFNNVREQKGQFIGKVDPGSVADAAGLKLGDRIVEVNGHNVVEETHKQVVQRIKAVPNETKLLVIDPSGQVYYAERNITITSSMPNVQKMRTPTTKPNRMNNRPDNLKLVMPTETNGTAPPKSSLKVFFTLHENYSFSLRS